MAVKNSLAPRAAAKHELLFDKPASGVVSDNPFKFSIMFLSKAGPYLYWVGH
jgi:hypothetical protein